MRRGDVLVKMMVVRVWLKVRRGTLEDAKGVLHHGPVGSVIGETMFGGSTEGKRPVVDRSETASLD